MILYVLEAMRKLSDTDLSTLPDVMFKGDTIDEIIEYVRDNCNHVSFSAAVSECERAGTTFYMNCIPNIMGVYKEKYKKPLKIHLTHSLCPLVQMRMY